MNNLYQEVMSFDYSRGSREYARGYSPSFEILDEAQDPITSGEGLSEAGIYEETVTNGILPEIVIMPIYNTLAYAAYTSTLPSNICFQVKIRDATRVQQTYPTAIVGQTIRLYYPDYQSFQRFVEEGLLQVLGIPSGENIVRLKLVTTKRNRISKELQPNKEAWDDALASLRAMDIGGKVGEGLGSSHKVKLFVSLA